MRLLCDDVTDHAAIPDFSAGAMENWGLVLYRESALLHDDGVSSMYSKYWVSLVIAHEIAHTVWGSMFNAFLEVTSRYSSFGNSTDATHMV
jgi:Peptidase family M1 domain